MVLRRHTEWGGEQVLDLGQGKTFQTFKVFTFFTTGWQGIFLLKSLHCSLLTLHYESQK